jgi:hypothetical protein
MKKVIYFLAIIATLASCTETPIMIPEFVAPKTNRVVLIEDLTGVRCPNCPKGGAAIESIREKFVGNVVAVGIHGNFLTTPLPENKYDFRNPKAKALEEFLKPFLGKPSAHINRRFFEGQAYEAVDAVELWQAFVEEELNRPEEMDIELTKAYDETTRILTINIKATSFINEAGLFKTSVYITESKIEDVQETQGKIIEDYEHNHVLRDMITSATGDDFTNDLTINKVTSKEYTYTIPQDFKAENMEVIVMVSRSKSDDKSVLQAQAVSVK